MSWWTCLWALHCLGGPVCGHYTVLVDLSVGTTLSWWTCLWALHCLGGPVCGHYTVLVDLSVGTTLSWWTCLWALRCLGGPVCGRYTVLVDLSVGTTLSMTSGQQPVGNDVMFQPSLSVIRRLSMSSCYIALRVIMSDDA